MHTFFFRILPVLIAYVSQNILLIEPLVPIPNFIEIRSVLVVFLMTIHVRADVDECRRALPRLDADVGRQLRG